MIAAVETIYDKNFRDIVVQLRDRADEIEAGKPVEKAFYIEVEEDGTLTPYGWGNISTEEAYVLLDKTRQHLLDNYF